MVLSLVLLLLAFGWVLVLRKRRKIPLPPGPPADPLLGHLRYIPAENPEFQFTEWAKAYGDVMYLRILNRSVIVLSSAQAVLDLLDKRGANYSDRPRFPVLETMGWDNSLAFLPYGKKFQKHRRLYQEYLSPAKVSDYENILSTQAGHLALSLARGNQDTDYILQKFGTAVVVRIAFGHDMFREADPIYDNITKENQRSMKSCGPPGATPVDFLPILRYLPAWIPGTFYAHRAREFSELVRRMHDYPIEQTLQGLAEGKAKSSFLAHHLDRLQQKGTDEDSWEDFQDVRGAAGTIFAAGSDTMTSTLSVFMLAMVLHPQCQAKAHEELDRVLSSRLPTLADRKSLPYIDCIVQETYRWLPVTPLGTYWQSLCAGSSPRVDVLRWLLGLPHRTLEDDIYDGMFIPKGTNIFANVWGISRDERVYRDASCFNPSRYEGKAEGGNEEPFPIATFGFGRRICPGRHLAEANIWNAVATILTLFKIEKVKNELGEDIVPQVRMQTGLSSHPKPYECKIQIRNDIAKALLSEVEAELGVTI